MGRRRYQTEAHTPAVGLEASDAQRAPEWDKGKVPTAGSERGPRKVRYSGLIAGVGHAFDKRGMELDVGLASTCPGTLPVRGRSPQEGG